MHKWYTQGKINKVLAELKAGLDTDEVCRKYGVSKSSVFRWKRAAEPGRKYKVPKVRVESREGRLSQLEFVVERLLLLKFSVLPVVDFTVSDNQVSRELVEVATKLYAFTTICHYRELLRGYRILHTRRAEAPALVVAQRLYEVAAQAYAVEKSIGPALRSGHLPRCWVALRELLAEPGETFTPISKLVVGLSAHSGTTIAYADYAAAAEFAQSGPPTLRQYSVLDVAHHCIRFPEWPRMTMSPPVASVLTASMTVCERVHSILAAVRETLISADLKRLLLLFIERGGVEGEL